MSDNKDKSITKHPFHHTLPLQQRFHDIDLLGHVNNSIYFSYYDLGKVRYFEAVRGGHIKWGECDVVVANVNCDFVMPVYMNENIEVQTQVTEIGNRSFKLLQQIVNSENGELKSVCHTTMVSFDIEKGISAPLSDDWKNALEKYEQRSLLKEKTK